MSMQLINMGVKWQAKKAKKQYALGFDGVGNYVDLGNIQPKPEKFEVQMKINTGDDTTSQQWVFGRLWLNKDNFTCILRNKRLEFIVRENGINKPIISQEVNANTDYDIILTYDKNAGLASLSVVGVLKSINITGFNLVNFEDGSLIFGAAYNLNMRFFEGQLKNLVYKNFLGNNIADYDFTTGSGNILFDKSGNNNHGTIYGAQWVEI